MPVGLVTDRGRGPGGRRPRGRPGPRSGGRRRGPTRAGSWRGGPAWRTGSSWCRPCRRGRPGPSRPNTSKVALSGRRLRSPATIVTSPGWRRPSTSWASRSACSARAGVSCLAVGVPQAVEVGDGERAGCGRVHAIAPAVAGPLTASVEQAEALGDPRSAVEGPCLDVVDERSRDERRGLADHRVALVDEDRQPEVLAHGRPVGQADRTGVAGPRRSPGGGAGPGGRRRTGWPGSTGCARRRRSRPSPRDQGSASPPAGRRRRPRPRAARPISSSWRTPHQALTETIRTSLSCRSRSPARILRPASAQPLCQRDWPSL